MTKSVYVTYPVSVHHIEGPLTLVLVASSEHSHAESVPAPVRDRELNTGDLVGVDTRGDRVVDRVC